MRWFVLSLGFVYPSTKDGDVTRNAGDTRVNIDCKAQTSAGIHVALNLGSLFDLALPYLKLAALTFLTTHREGFRGLVNLFLAPIVAMMNFYYLNLSIKNKLCYINFIQLRNKFLVSKIYENENFPKGT